MKLVNLNILSSLDHISQVKNKNVISTINAHSYNTLLKDEFFKEALLNSNYVLPDGVGITMAINYLKGKNLNKISGYDFFIFQCNYLNKIKGTCFFLGSSVDVLNKIKRKMNAEYPNIIVKFYSPPFKKNFSKSENKIMVEAVNKAKPHTLFVGMTAPKQEKWVYENFNNINANIIASIGAVFDFYSGNKKRAPKFMINLHMEWLHRFMSEPLRLYKRYLIGNFKFIYNVLKNELN